MSTLYDNYKIWCERVNNRKSATRRSFGIKVRELLPNEHEDWKKNSVIYYNLSKLDLGKPRREYNLEKNVKSQSTIKPTTIPLAPPHDNKDSGSAEKAANRDSNIIESKISNSIGSDQVEFNDQCLNVRDKIINPVKTCYGKKDDLNFKKDEKKDMGKV